MHGQLFYECLLNKYTYVTATSLKHFRKVVFATLGGGKGGCAQFTIYKNWKVEKMDFQKIKIFIFFCFPGA